MNPGDASVVEGRMRIEPRCLVVLAALPASEGAPGFPLACDEADVKECQWYPLASRLNYLIKPE